MAAWLSVPCWRDRNLLSTHKATGASPLRLRDAPVLALRSFLEPPRQEVMGRGTYYQCRVGNNSRRLDPPQAQSGIPLVTRSPTGPHIGPRVTTSSGRMGGGRQYGGRGLPLFRLRCSGVWDINRSPYKEDLLDRLRDFCVVVGLSLGTTLPQLAGFYTFHRECSVHTRRYSTCSHRGGATTAISTVWSWGNGRG